MQGKSLWRCPDVTRGCCSEACGNVQGSSRAVSGKAQRRGNGMAPAPCGRKQRPLSDLPKDLRALNGVLSTIWIGSLSCLDGDIPHSKTAVVTRNSTSTEAKL